MDDLEKRLGAKMYRILCPPPIELGEYVLGMLPQARAASIRSHLSECPHCTLEVKGFESYLAELAPELEPDPRAMLGDLAERVQVWIARRLAPGTGGMAPAFSLRGEAREGPQQYQAGEASLTLEVQDDPHQPGRKTVLGLLMGTRSGGWKAQLWQAGQALAATEVDELGNFVLEGVAPGEYELVLNGEGQEILVEGVEIAN